MQKLFRFRSMRLHIIVSFSAFFAVLGICVAGVVIPAFSAKMVGAQENAATDLARRVSLGMDSALLEIETLMNTIIYNRSITQAVGRFGLQLPFERLQSFQQAQELLKGTVLQKESITAAYLFSSGGLCAYFEKKCADQQGKQSLSRHGTGGF